MGSYVLQTAKGVRALDSNAPYLHTQLPSFVVLYSARSCEMSDPEALWTARETDRVSHSQCFAVAPNVGFHLYRFSNVTSN
jgi:hypothetical protein